MDSQKEEIIQENEIGMWIEDYEYLFSDFDQRPLSQRGFSEDFLEEIKKISLVKNSEDLIIKLLVPKTKRNYAEEIIIKKRFKAYFKKHSFHFKKEYGKVLKQGAGFFLFGIICMVIATFFLVNDKGTNYLLTFLGVIFEPAGWFLFWEGLNLLIFESKKRKPNADFYSKMSKSKIIFMDSSKSEKN